MPLVQYAGGELRAEPATHLVKTSGSAKSRVAVGDWVALAFPEGHDVALIEAILPRRSAFKRKDPGEATGQQVIAANVDIVFVVITLSRELNLRRLERELVLAWESGAQPVVVLTKADLCPEDVKSIATDVAAAAPGVEVHVTSSVTGEGLDEVTALVAPGLTATTLGASGVGKSTLINRLVGADLQATSSVREADGKGRHTTVAREMVSLPGGGILIDTPGMRALALWDADDGIASTFPEIAERVVECKFRDCAHEDEPGCAVIEGVASGAIPQRRLDSWRSLRAELDALALQQEAAARIERARRPQSGSETPHGQRRGSGRR